MSENKTQNEKRKTQNYSLKFKVFIVLSFTFYFCALRFALCVPPAEEQSVYDAKGRRDPFIPLVTPDGRLLNLDTTEQAKGALTLEGIIYDERSVSYAIVNAAVVKIGDTVDGNQVLKIESNKVVFIKDGNPFEIELKEAK